MKTNVNLDEIFAAQQRAEALKKEAKELESFVKTELDKGFSCSLDAVLKADFGTSHVECENFCISRTIPKKVEWCQEIMERLAEEIENDCGNPADYIDIKTTYNIPETRFKSFPAKIQLFFEPARTLTPGAIKYTITKEE